MDLLYGLFGDCSDWLIRSLAGNLERLFGLSLITASKFCNQAGNIIWLNSLLPLVHRCWKAGLNGQRHHERAGLTIYGTCSRSFCCPKYQFASLPFSWFVFYAIGLVSSRNALETQCFSLVSKIKRSKTRWFLLVGKWRPLRSEHPLMAHGFCQDAEAEERPAAPPEAKVNRGARAGRMG